jgi:hypothetical protein
VAQDVKKPFSETHAGLRVDFVGLEGLLERLGAGAIPQVGRGEARVQPRL